GLKRATRRRLADLLALASRPRRLEVGDPQLLLAGNELAPGHLAARRDVVEEVDRMRPLELGDRALASAVAADDHQVHRLRGAHVVGAEVAEEVELPTIGRPVRLPSLGQLPAGSALSRADDEEATIGVEAAAGDPALVGRPTRPDHRRTEAVLGAAVEVAHQ